MYVHYEYRKGYLTYEARLALIVEYQYPAFLRPRDICESERLQIRSWKCQKIVEFNSLKVGNTRNYSGELCGCHSYIDSDILH